MSSSVVAADQIEQRKKIDPDYIDEVPIEACVFDRSVVVLVVVALPGKHGENGEQADANDHVDSVHTRHHKIEREEHLRVLLIDGRQVFVPGNVLFDEIETRARHVVLGKFCAILDGLDAQECNAENNGCDQIEDKQLLLATLGGVDRENDG